MLKPLAFLIVSFLINFGTFAQGNYDLLYTINGTKEVKIKELGFNSVKYIHPNEETVYTISKYQVEKIVFASGREEIFDSPIKEVGGLNDFKKVYVTYNTDDIAGLIPRGELFSKAIGATTLSGINQVNNRALDKLKIEAAMVGANVVLIGSTFQRGNQYGGESQSGSATQTSYSGTAYSTHKIDPQTLKSIIETRSFHHYQTHKLNRNSWSPDRTISSKFEKDGKPITFKIDELIENDGEFFVKVANIPSKVKELKVVYADDEKLILMERNDIATINYLLITEENKFFKNIANRLIF